MLFQLYELLSKKQAHDRTEHEIRLAAGLPLLSGEESITEYIKKLKREGPIIDGFAHQTEMGSVSFQSFISSYFNILIAYSKAAWDQDEFERLLNIWLVACDQPFDEVEKPELRDLLQYVYHRANPLKIPSAKTVRTKIMKMGENSVAEMREFFAVRISLLFQSIMISDMTTSF
jgi:hypothetical protein